MTLDNPEEIGDIAAVIVNNFSIRAAVSTKKDTPHADKRLGIAAMRHGIDPLHQRVGQTAFTAQPRRDRVDWFDRLIIFLIVLHDVFLFNNPAVYAVPQILLTGTEAVLGEAVVKILLGFSDEFLWNTLIGALVAVHLYGVAVLSRCMNDAVPDGMARAVRWCAGATFTIYILHYPALQFFDALLAAEMAKYTRQALMFIGVLLLCFACAEISERRLAWLRRVLSGRSLKVRS